MAWGYSPLWGEMPHHSAWPTASYTHMHQRHFKSWRILVFLVAPSSATETCRCFLHPHPLLFFYIYPHMQSTEHSVCSSSSVLFPLFPRCLVCHTAAYFFTVPACGHPSLEAQARGAPKATYVAVPLCTNRGLK